MLTKEESFEHDFEECTGCDETVQKRGRKMNRVRKIL